MMVGCRKEGRDDKVVGKGGSMLEGWREKEGMKEGCRDGQRERRRLDQRCCWYLVIYSANVLSPFA